MRGRLADRDTSKYMSAQTNGPTRPTPGMSTTVGRFTGADPDSAPTRSTAIFRWRPITWPFYHAVEEGIVVRFRLAQTREAPSVRHAGYRAAPVEKSRLLLDNPARADEVAEGVAADPKLRKSRINRAPRDDACNTALSIRRLLNSMSPDRGAR